jgi:serine protease
VAAKQRFRRVLSACAVAAGVALLGSTPRGQTYWTRSFLGDYAPRAIEQGISPDLTHAPGTSETRIKASVRPANRLQDAMGASGAVYVPGRVIVKFRDNTTGTSRISAMSALSRGSAPVSQPDHANFDVVQIGLGEDAEAVAESFRQRPEVEYAQPAYRVRSRLRPNDPFFRDGSQWNLTQIHLESAWDIQPAAGSAIVVALLDTGIAYKSTTVRMHASAFSLDEDGFVGPPGGSGTQYPALGDLTLSYTAASQLVPAGRFVAPFDFIWNDSSPIDFDGHGTHVSGTIGQTTNDGVGTAGVAFNVKLMPVKVLDSTWDDIFGSPNFSSDDTIARGIRYATDNGAKIINMSLGRTGPRAPVIEDAMRYAVSRGVFIAVAGGNEFEEGNPVEVIAEIASRVNGAVSVGAVDPARNHAYYSNTGSYIELVAPGGSFRGYNAEGGVLQQTFNPDFVETFTRPPAQFTAPRFDVLAYVRYTGTSMATPHVAALAAMLMQQGITEPAAIEAALEYGAMDLGSRGRDNTYGYGLVDAYSTLRGLGLAR